MTTSSNHQRPTPPPPSGKHWQELTATLPQQPAEAFADWLSRRLEDLEMEQAHFTSPKSLKKSLRR